MMRSGTFMRRNDSASKPVLAFTLCGLALAAAPAHAGDCGSWIVPTQTFTFVVSPAQSTTATRRIDGLPVVEESISEAATRGRSALLALREDATPDDPAYEPLTLTKLARLDSNDEGDDVLMRTVTLALRGGERVTVAEDQGVVDAFGRVRKASNLRLGQSIMRADGNFGIVRGLEFRPHYEAPFVVGVAAKRESPTLVVSGGVLVALEPCVME